MLRKKMITQNKLLMAVGVAILLLHLSVHAVRSCPPVFPPRPPQPPSGPSPQPPPEPPVPPAPACGRGALQLTPNGLGDLLLFPYWTTEGRTTLIAIGSGVGGQENTFVHVRVRECMESQDVRDFTICLSPGDVWTASLTPRSENASSLTVGSPGSCDNAVREAGFTSPPLLGQDVLVQATCGYIEAFTVEACSESSVGGDDIVWGIGTVVDVSSAAAVSYPATAVVEVNAENEGYDTVGDSALAAAIAREGGVDKEILHTRYMVGGSLAASTQIVLTFPAGRQPGVTDPVSAFFFDEDENSNFSPRQVTLPDEVNVCSLEAGADGVAALSCPGTDNSILVVGRDGSFTSGWLRLINNTVGADGDPLDTGPATRFPVLGLVFISAFMDGVQGDHALPLQWLAIAGAGGFGGVSSFSLGPPQRFVPWQLPDRTSLIPGDNTTGGLPLTGGN